MDPQTIQKIRGFNRFYTHFLGLLDKYILQSKYTLPEVRVLYELYHIKNGNASEIVQTLDMDKSYLSRMLLQFEKKNLITKKKSKNDKRSAHIQLTSLGRKEFLILNKASDAQINSLLTHISKKDLFELLNHMEEIEKILDKNKSK